MMGLLAALTIAILTKEPRRAVLSSQHLHCTTFRPTAEQCSTDQRTLVVVSHFKENLTWVDEIPAHMEVVIYSKGGLPVEAVTAGLVREVTATSSLKNVGREAHSMLHHILQFYDDLHDVMVFLPGNSGRHPWRIDSTNELLSNNWQQLLHAGGCCCKKNDNATLGDGPLLELTAEATTGKLWRLPSDPSNRVGIKDGRIRRAKHRPLGNWLRHYFTQSSVDWVEAQVARGKDPRRCYNGVVAVHKDRILRWPKEVYQKINNELGQHHNPESLYFMEQLWFLLWGDPGLHLATSFATDNHM
jgi:hypothetical protein